jgi:hypothetical protein
MRVRLIASGAVLAIILCAADASAQAEVHFSGAAGVSLPIGNLGDASSVGFNLNARGEVGITRAWSWRSDFSWDRFGGKADVSNTTYLGFGGNILHRQMGPLYEYGGLGVYNQRQALQPPFVDLDEWNLGVQGGVGYDFPRTGGTNTFIEIGVVNVFTSGLNSAWFPVRFGIRF